MHKGLDTLKGIYSDSYLQLLDAILEEKGLSFDDIKDKLPSSELVKKDEDFVETYPVARVLMKVADPASHVLTAYHLMREIPEDYPEQPRYYISTSEGYVDAVFTKQEFIESIGKKESKNFIK